MRILRIDRRELALTNGTVATLAILVALSHAAIAVLAVLVLRRYEGSLRRGSKVA